MQSGHIHQTLILGIDASFIPKSGKATAGVGSFWNGCHSRVETGLELSCCTLISVHDRQAFPIHVQQTKPTTTTTDNRTEQYNTQLSWTKRHLPGLSALERADRLVRPAQSRPACSGR